MRKNNLLEGACFDSGAWKPVTGKLQADVYALFAFSKSESITLKTHCIIREVSQACFGKIIICLPIALSFFAPIKVQIKDVDISFLLDLGLLSYY